MAVPSFVSLVLVYVVWSYQQRSLLWVSLLIVVTSPSGAIKPPSSISLCCLAFARFMVGAGGLCGGRWLSAPGCRWLGWWQTLHGGFVLFASHVVFHRLPFVCRQWVFVWVGLRHLLFLLFCLFNDWVNLDWWPFVLVLIQNPLRVWLWFKNPKGCGYFNPKGSGYWRIRLIPRKSFSWLLLIRELLILGFCIVLAVDPFTILNL